mmetsp:Transcript_1043/g.2229  ORF Transcript_1043/g.2229 Transcript_1043/m.2229 type:complete len:95 (-) Transcript_1043:227-511(-)
MIPTRFSSRKKEGIKDIGVQRLRDEGKAKGGPVEITDERGKVLKLQKGDLLTDTDSGAGFNLEGNWDDSPHPEERRKDALNLYDSFSYDLKGGG